MVAQEKAEGNSPGQVRFSHLPAFVLEAGRLKLTFRAEPPDIHGNGTPLKKKRTWVVTVL
jgi:hypothetical protein